MRQAANTKKWRQILGDLGEKLAEEHLQERGYHKLECKYRAGRAGELDLIMVECGITADTDINWLVFVEVKTRLQEDELESNGQMAVDVVKQRKILQAALAYMHSSAAENRVNNLRPRFDVVLVTFPCSREKLSELMADRNDDAIRDLARITHIQAAFGTL